jgi:hypothetical protein
VNTDLLQFYLGIAPDSRGRMLTDILAWQDPNEWEKCHDFIQWVFPLPEPSSFNPNAPLLDADTLEAFKASSVCMANAAKAYTFAQRFLWQKGVSWLNKGDHNHLRITRIMRFMALVGYPTAARNIYHNVVKIARGKPEAVSETTLQFWQDAAGIVPEAT